MAGAGDVEMDAVLSDVEGEDQPAATLIGNIHIPEHVPVERYAELSAELDRERAARRAAEDSKEEAVEKLNRVRKVAQEAIQKRDEAESERDEALKSRERITAELNEVAEQRDEVARQLDGAMRARDSLRLEMENSRHLLVSGIEKISGKLSEYMNFAATGGGGLPKSPKYSGMPAVAYGVLKRTNEIVEELVKQIHAANRSGNDARDQIEQRNFEIAIEVSQLEATIGGLRRELEGKTALIGELQKAVAEKEIMASEIERGMWDKAQLEDKLRDLETKLECLKPLLIDQSNFSWKIHEQLFGAMKIVDKNYQRHEVPASLFFQEQKDIGENLSASLAGMKSIYELTRVVGEKTKGVIQVKDHELKRSAETVGQLVREKEHISYLLRSALSKRPTWDPSSKANDLFQAAENGLRDAGIDFKFSKFLGDHKFTASPRENGGGSLAVDPEDGEIYTLAGALEKVVKASQLEIIELRHCVEELRNESSSLKEQIDIQAKELSSRMRRIEELEEKQRATNENIEGLLMDITAAEEEIRRWKVTAEQEAAAGHAVEKDFASQLSTLKKEVEEAKQATLESEKKVKLKEETAAAAMAAREAAEKSLRLADVRASRLRERTEELSRQLEEFETREEASGDRSRKYVCWWPFSQWPGLNLVAGTHANHETYNSSSISLEELSEPLI
ncbi:unnamed protein product [Linum trigynum]|uniref:Uncharacterized protein n=1 Tax=Linum trigynum TaxID=586398 RepID=A0AAV2ECF8_9ROSI